MAGITEVDVLGALHKAAAGFKKNYKQGDEYHGSFGYTSPGGGSKGNGLTGLTGAATLCLQFIGEGNSREVLGGLGTLQDSGRFNWGIATWDSIYYWYYDTQARFHAGGDSWNAWNKQFSMPLVQNQTVVPGAIEWSGKMHDIGYWQTPQDRQGYILNTTLCCLMLQVYYRYLPTFKPPEPGVGGGVQEAGNDGNNVQINIQI